MKVDLTTSAMLASLSISVWTARRFDKKATTELHNWHSVPDDTGRYTKKLLPKNTQRYTAITAAASAGRKAFYENTLPWTDSGSRILPAANFIEFNRILRECQRTFDDAIPLFVEQYPFLQRAAQTAQKDLYRAEDWPNKDRLREYFAWELKFWPLPDKQDFRVEISAEQASIIRSEIENEVQMSVSKAMDEPFRRLFDGVAHVAARLSESKVCPCRNCKGKTYTTGDFKDSLIANLIELCDVLPRLNLTRDEYLQQMIDLVKSSLTEFKPDLVRNNDHIRKSLAQRAKDLQESLSGWAGATQKAS